ncbi:MAG: cysteine desulfurase DndA [Marinospirillum sp.]|uniref:cysteine desulfurase DndA n=1 Tax=Marinospirillum sp. TaxID=2183934 RepID=UPI0019DC3999|nr:cysteine desulfurase DndA [Marinospirillum sp.]MBE0506981.1 cysteine desulfurase DndA [Marinospirillum sp.]
MTEYLDMSASTPVLPEVAEAVAHHFLVEFGNAGSRTHSYGAQAKKAVEYARQQVANIVCAEKSGVIFTSGATESNNLAILGLRSYASEQKKRHVITTSIEHKAVLEPMSVLEKEGFEVTYLPVDESGVVSAVELSKALREDTVLVSVMHVNNETGSMQPIEALCDVLHGHDAYFHVDAAQSFGKISGSLVNERIDMMSVSGHKMYAPMGIGALILRKRGFMRVPLTPLMYGGGQERGLRPGTLPVPLIVGLGVACEHCLSKASQWQDHANSLKQALVAALDGLGAEYNGEQTSPYILNFSVPGVNSEAAMVALKDIVAVSNGSACTSSSYTPSHVLLAMGLSEERTAGAIRVSWGPMTKTLPVEAIVNKLSTLKI